MIEGLHFDLSSDELKAHLEARARHHDSRVEFYQGQAKQLRDGGAQPTNYSNGDPIRNLEEKAAGHLEARERFSWLATHVVKNETYRLSEADASKVELIKARGW